MIVSLPEISRFVTLSTLSVGLLAAGCTAGCAAVPGNASEEVLPLPAPESYPQAPIDPWEADFSASAAAFVSALGPGWNLGNTLDAHVQYRNEEGSNTEMTGTGTETSWGLPVTTQVMMTGLKASGIRVVRIPVSWHNHVDAAFTVDGAWMSRVKTVVDYALAEGLYAIINIHHDNEEAFYYPDTAHERRSTEYVKRVWKQIALTFRNYDERLIFELLNEPRLVGYAAEWNWSDSDQTLVDSAKTIGRIEQAALNEIRAAGSNNAHRYVMITPYAASPWAALSPHFSIPEDAAEGKLILSAHAYAPYSFAMEDPGEKSFTDSHKREIDSFMESLNDTFNDGLGMPVILGEYGATNKDNLSDRVAWFSYYCDKAASYGICAILWDNGNYAIPPSGKYGELFGYYDRTRQSWHFPTILEAVVDAYGR